MTAKMEIETEKLHATLQALRYGIATIRAQKAEIERLTRQAIENGEALLVARNRAIKAAEERASLAEREDALMITARKNLRHYIGSATFKCEADRTAAINCLDVIEENIGGLNDLVAVLRSAFAAASALRQPTSEVNHD